MGNLFDMNMFNAAMKLLKIGTTAEEFATNYADASQSAKGSSIWQKNYEQGLQQFKTIDFSKGSENKIDENEFNVVGLYVERLNGKSKNLPKTLETFSGNSGIESLRALEREPMKKSSDDIEEKQNLKPVDVMTKEELLAELDEYEKSQKADFKSGNDTERSQKATIQEEKGDMPEKMEADNLKQKDKAKLLAQLSKDKEKDAVKTNNPEDKELKSLRKAVSIARIERNEVDKNSDKVDFHAGTFNQGDLGSCAMLSQVNGLSDDKLKRIIKEKNDDNGKKYYEVTFPIDTNSGISVRVSEEELKNQSIDIADAGKTHMISGFTRGDADVTLLEMAYVKRFGVAPVINGGDLKFVNDIFTFPEENIQHVGSDYNVTEEKLLNAMKNGEHLSVGLRDCSRLSESFSYADIFTSESGVTAKWGFNNSGMRTSAEMVLKDMFEKYSGGQNSDISEFTKMSDAEFMDATNRYVSYDYGFIGALKLSNGYSLIENHAYTLKSYDPDKKELVLANPYASNEAIRIPLDVAVQFFDISG